MAEELSQKPLKEVKNYAQHRLAKRMVRGRFPFGQAIGISNDRLTRIPVLVLSPSGLHFAGGLSTALSPALTAQFEAQSGTKKKKGLDPAIQALDHPGGAERDRTVGLLNAIRNTAPIEPEISHKDSYPDAKSGD